MGVQDPNKYRLDGGGCLMATGCYLPMLTSMFFWPEKPERVVAAAHLGPHGCDEAGAMTLLYPAGKLASLTWSGAVDLPNTLTITGDRRDPAGGFATLHVHPLSHSIPPLICSKMEVLKVDENMWCPLTAQMPSGPVSERLDPGSETFAYPNGAGFIYEARAVRSALMEGEPLTSPFFPLTKL